MSDQDAEKEKQIKENYEQWKKTAPILYDMVITHALTWPSFTCQWLPTRQGDAEFVSQELLLGTHTSDEEDNFIQFLNMDLPVKGQDTPTEQKTKMYITQKLYHPGEVNRARYQPNQPNIIATKQRDGDVLIYDRTKSDPLLTLKGHTMEGYGLAWNQHESKTNHILSAGFDNIICHWDIQSSTVNDKQLQPYQRYQGHTAAVEDVSWNAINDTVFASVGDDSKLMIWDGRDPSKPVQKVQAHEGEANSVAFHPTQGWMVATGGADGTVGLFDIRKISQKLHAMELGEGEITQVAWSPHDDPILASASAGTDNRIVIWDLRHIGEEQTQEDAEDGPPEVMFVHSGHTSRISDFSWNPIDPWVLASTADNNVVQVWQMSKNIYANTDFLEVATSQLE